MLEVKGEFNTAKVFTENIEEGAITQIRTLCDMDFTWGAKIRVMPDVHAGAGCTIGTTMTIKDKVVPNMVGVDIGCGMETACIAEKQIDLEKLDKMIYRKIPSGYSIRDGAHKYNKDIDLSELKCKNHVDLGRAKRSIGTLGGGNHFIEIDKDDEGNLYFIVHSGSRHIGNEVAKLYQNWAYEQLGGKDVTSIPFSLAYVSGDLFHDYIHDMKLIQHFAFLNRKAIMDEMMEGMKLEVVEQFTTVHNYIDTDAMILRKGAVSARKNEKLLIPINMRDGSLICIGKGNEDWNNSGPHGAGRLFSRTRAKGTFTVSEFQQQMKGIYTTSVSKATLDECPMAYKDMKEIVKNIGPTAEVIKTISPIYNFKAGGN